MNIGRQGDARDHVLVAKLDVAIALEQRDLKRDRVRRVGIASDLAPLGDELATAGGAERRVKYVAGTLYDPVIPKWGDQRPIRSGIRGQIGPGIFGITGVR